MVEPYKKVLLSSGQKILMMLKVPKKYSTTEPICVHLLLKVNGQRNLKKFKVIDLIIKEPLGGAHRNPSEIQDNVKKQLINVLEELQPINKEELVKKRRSKYLKFGSNLKI